MWYTDCFTPFVLEGGGELYTRMLAKYISFTRGVHMHSSEH